MTNKAQRFFDAFTFALGGVSIACSYVAIPVVASDRIAKAWDARLAGEKSAGGTPLNGGQFAAMAAEYS